MRRGANVQIAYYDQQREQLDPERTVFDTIGEGNDTVTANGRTRHVNAYLSDFLFSHERAASPVKALSGGERNRLLLARLFTRPANVLVLDEPTNDLDIETLELLEEVLVEWPGTLLLVSHDRVFLDDVVTSTLVFEGEGRIQEYVGGYHDWVRQRDAAMSSDAAVSRRFPSTQHESRHVARTRDSGEGVNDAADGLQTVPSAAVHKRKLSYKEQRELHELPARIEALEQEQRALEARISGPDFYKSSRAEIEAALARVDPLAKALLDAYARWHDLESRAPP
jgi:ATP-binding cassette subfamily F protein uup